MKLVLFNDYVPGVLKNDRVVDISNLVAAIPHIDGQTLMSGLIENFDRYRTAISQAAEATDGVAVDQVRLRPPLPSPGKIVCMAVNYMEDGTPQAAGGQGGVYQVVQRRHRTRRDGRAARLPCGPLPP